MARKSALTGMQVKEAQRELSQPELEAAATEHTKVVPVQEASRRGRIKNAMGIPSGDAETGEVVDIIASSIEVNHDALDWRYGEGGTSATSKQVAEIILRAVRYGVPYEEFEGEGFHIRDNDLGDAPLCADCQEAENG